MNDDTPALEVPVWYRQFWPWFLMALPASAVVAGLATVVIAVRGADDLVVDDYASIGRITEQALARDREARRLALDADLRLGAPDELTRVTLHGLRATGAVLHLRHPTRAIDDRRCQLHPAANGDLVCALGPLPDAHWWVSLEDLEGRWRLSGRARSSPDLQPLTPRLDGAQP